MWTTRTNIVPVIIGILRTFKNGLDETPHMLLSAPVGHTATDHTNH
jgi:hypothetical protein